MTDTFLINLVEIPNPFKPSETNRSTREVRQGQTLDDLFPPAVTNELKIAVNGKIIDDQDRPGYYLTEGDYVVICPVVEGGGNGGAKAVLRLVAMIALSTVAGPIAGSLYSAMGGTYVMANAAMVTATLQAGVMVAGGLLINALLPPPKPKTPEASSATYGIDGAKNTSAEGVVVPVCYGTFRMAGNIVNNYVVNDGDTQWLYMLICAGEGPLAGIEEIHINDQRVETYDVATTPYKDVEVAVRLGEETQTPIPWFDGQVVPQSQNHRLTNNWRTVTTSGQIDAVRLDFTAPGGIGYNNSKGEVEAITVSIEAQYQLQGTSTWLPLRPENDPANYEEVVTWQTVSTVTGFDEVNGGGNPLLNNTTYVPNGSEYKVGDAYYTNNPLYGSEPTLVGLVRQRATGNTLFRITSDKVGNPLRRSMRVAGLPQGVYSIRVRRTDVENSLTDTRFVDTVLWTDLNEITTERVSYPYTALVGVKARLGDQLSGMPNVTYLSRGKKVLAWDDAGAKWVYKGSSNPAWITLDVMTAGMYGGGAELRRFDLEAWKDWGRWCDQNNLEFNGVFDTQQNVWDSAQKVARVGRATIVRVGTRYTVAIERASDPVMMFTVANMIEGTFEESWSSLTERANEIEGTFADAQDNYRQRTIRVYDRDAAAAGRPARSVTLELMGVTSAQQAWDDLMIQLNMNRYIQRSIKFSTDMEALACTVGDVILVQHDMPQWGTGGRLEAGCTTTLLKFDREVTFQPGQTYRALVHHSAIMRLSGTVSAVMSAAEETYITLSGYTAATTPARIKVAGKDLEVLRSFVNGASRGVVVALVTGITVGATYQLWDSDVIDTVDLVNPATSANVVATQATLAAGRTLLAAPAQFTNYMFGPVSKVAKPFRVRSIGGSHEYQRDVTAVEYNASVYTPAGAVPTQNYSSLPLYVSHATIGGVTESLRLQGLTYQTRATVSFSSAQQTYSESNVYLSRNGGAWEWVGKDIYSVTVDATKDEVLKFRVVAVDVLGRSAPESSAPTITYTVVGKASLPTPLTGLAFSFTNTGIRVVHNTPVEEDWLSTQASTSSTFGAGTIVSDAKTTSFEWPFRATGTHTLWLRKFVQHQVSSTPQSLQIQVLAPATLSVSASDAGNGVALASWGNARTSQPIRRHIIRVGNTTQAWSALTDFTVVGGGTLTERITLPGNGTYRIWVVAEDEAGNQGTPAFATVTVSSSAAVATQTASVALYQWSAAQPLNPNGASTYTWSTGAQATYTGGNGWAITPPANPGTPGIQLWKAEKVLTASAGSTTTSVDWTTGVTVLAVSANGLNGGTGTNATAYWLVSSAAAVRSSTTGTFTPGSLTFSSLSATGTNAPAAYAGRFIIATSTDGTTFVDQYTSATNESSRSFTVPANTRAVRARLYLAGGTTSLIDEELVPIVFDGATGATGSTGAAGAPGASAISAVLSNETHALPSTSAGGVTTYTGSGTEVRVFEGATALAYDGVGTANGTWTFTTTASNVTVGAIVDSGTFATVGQASGVASGIDAASITFNITGRTLAGTAFSVTKTQTLTKAKAGSDGATGARFATVSLFRWALTIPTITGISTYTWSNGAIGGTIPSGWSTTPGTGSAGQTLWRASVNLMDSATTSTSNVDWSVASILGVGYIGSDGAAGAAGAPGPQGVSTRIAYSKTSASSLGSGTVTTSGGTSFPPAGSWSGGTWSGSPPTLVAGESLYMTYGAFNGTNTVWEAPFLATLKVGSLSAISANLGSITAGSMNINNKFIVDANGYLVARGIVVQDEAGNTVLSTKSGSTASVPSTWVQPDSGWLNSNVRSGGVNLVGNSGFMRHNGTLPTGWNIYNALGVAATSSVQSGGMFGQNYFRVTLSASTTSMLGVSVAPSTTNSVQAWEPGQTFCVSFWARGSGGSVGKTMTAAYSDMGFDNWEILEAPAIAAGWQRYVFRGVPRSNAFTSQGQLFISWLLSGSLASGSVLDICCPKVELGTSPTAWSPAVIDTLNLNLEPSITSAANQAQQADTNASTALAQLSDIANDSRLTPVEKQLIRKEWEGISGEYYGILDQATALGITTERDNYTTAWDSLGTYMNGGASWNPGFVIPTWINDSNLAVTTTITGSTFRVFWTSFYNARQVLLNKIAEVASTRATWANVSSRPADSELLNSFVPVGTNRLTGSEQINASGWQQTYIPNGAAFDSAFSTRSRQTSFTTSTYKMAGSATDSFVLRQLGRNTLSVDTSSSGANLMSADFWWVGELPGTDVHRGAIQVIPGERLCFSVYVTAHRCDYRLYVGFYTATDTSPSQYSVGSIHTADEGLSHSLSVMQRRHHFATVPAGCVRAVFFIRKFDTYVGQTDSYLWLAAPQVESARASQTAPAPYAPAALHAATYGIAPARQVLAGAAGLAVGNLTWDSAGNYQSGSGLGLTSRGIVAHNGTNETFVLDGTNGSARFGGTLSVGSTPAISGSTMTGSGAVINPSGTFALGNSARNLSFNGSTLTLNGELIVTGNIVGDLQTVFRSTSASGETNSVATVTVASITITPDFTGLMICMVGGFLGYESLLGEQTLLYDITANTPTMSNARGALKVQNVGAISSPASLLRAFSVTAGVPVTFRYLLSSSSSNGYADYDIVMTITGVKK